MNYTNILEEIMELGTINQNVSYPGMIYWVGSSGTMYVTYQIGDTWYTEFEYGVLEGLPSSENNKYNAKVFLTNTDTLV